MYERFLEQNTGCTRQTVHDAFLAKYADTAPKELIALWQEVGLGIFCNGLFRVINPADYQEFVDEYYQREYNEGAIPFMVTAFGDLFVYVKSRQIRSHVVYLNVRYGTFQIFTADLSFLLNILLINKSSLRLNFKLDQYPGYQKDMACRKPMNVLAMFLLCRQVEKMQTNIYK